MHSRTEEKRVAVGTLRDGLRPRRLLDIYAKRGGGLQNSV